jgi:methylglutaconyl-CoA hydratase
MPYEFLQTRRLGVVEYVTLNRPEVRNAFNEQVIDELAAWADSIAKGADVRAVVLAGAGKTFCAGADLNWMARMASYSTEDNVMDATRAAQMYAALDRLPVPLIGRIHGAAIGGGAGLAVVCDIVVAASDTVFGFTEVKVGILPAVISPYVLAKLGASATRELFVTGMRFDAQRAKEAGLIHAVAAEADLDARVAAYLREILGAAPGAIAAVKDLLRAVHGRAPQDVMGLTAGALAQRRASDEGREGLQSFLEKRKPRWHVELHQQSPDRE